MNIGYWSMDGQMEVTDMPLCPLCDQPLFEGEELVAVSVDRCLGLAHLHCAQEEDEGDE